MNGFNITDTQNQLTGSSDAAIAQGPLTAAVDTAGTGDAVIPQTFVVQQGNVAVPLTSAVQQGTRVPAPKKGVQPHAARPAEVKPKGVPYWLLARQAYVAKVLAQRPARPEPVRVARPATTPPTQPVQNGDPNAHWLGQ